MEIILFTVVGIAVYFAADRALFLIEKQRGKPLPNRSVFFFVIFLMMILLSFELIRHYVSP